ncbi:hypothetical protein [Puerhibacterium puerhi]|uniref:hypothetical protein n=1 Tax=Puerhibacterium puerhi TaxID=2692623 RepID=UPI00135B2884|nr:hypothetical protein [Puerhibacterium puerhi]
MTHTEAERLTMTAHLTHAQAAARDTLRDLLPPGATVRVIIRHVSASGMMRTISPVVVVGDSVRDLSGLVARAGIGFREDSKRYGLRVGGAGMDMGFHLVYSLSSALYPDGFKCTGHQYTETRRNGRRVLGCPSNAHANHYGAMARVWNETHPDKLAAMDDADYRRSLPSLTPDERKAAQRELESIVAERQAWIAAQPNYRRGVLHRDGGYALHYGGAL